MKKLVSLCIVLITLGISAMSVSAAEYEVHKGDTLWDIASSHDTTVDELMDINGLKSSLIFPKQVLKLNKAYYTVQKGDTLSEISQAYGDKVTVLDLKSWNDLPSDLIIVGQQLIVNGSETQPESKRVEKTANTDARTQKSESVAESKEVSKPDVEEKTEEPQTKAEGRTLSVEATAYTAYCTGCSGISATGVNLRENPNAKIIAVDPDVIPLGSKVYVEGYGYAVAADTGGEIIGNTIDVHLPTKEQAYSWGRRTVDVTIVD
ncbi:LysM peptidoglycan-binding domain-containing protein [Virgibacillus dakarensis]|uniref:LysM peptidoglycan-binding and 3D domain-containing protein n=1 Tax=Virgibacillus dakarensis TaxID=1917889 RepID=UPI000B435688|nr:3D domain-containing protein [Virgibacillus dakarensis]MTW85026.1 LysM peptidoglycan-binding domain-containing protein [Virgibacillus dakarensis]